MRMNHVIQHYGPRALLAGLLLAPALLPAQELIRNFGEERVGTTALSFLKIGVGARAEGMAQAFVGVADDGSALYWNPAGLGRMSGGLFSVTHLEWPAEITYDYIGLVQNINERLTLGMAYAQLKTDEMPVTTETHPTGDGRTFYFIDQSLQATAGLRMTDQFSFGISLKYIREDIDDVSLSTVLGDLGTFYRTGWRDMSIAVSLSNFGGVVQPDGSYLPANSDDGRRQDYEEFSPPTIFRIGSAMTLFSYNEHHLLGSGQINHPVDNQESYAIGMEYDWLKRYFLRGGWKINAGEESWTLGAGLDFRINRMAIVLDISYSDFGILSESKRTSAQLAWEDWR